VKLLVATVTVAAFALWVGPSREPRYRGKALSTWFDEASFIGWPDWHPDNPEPTPEDLHARHEMVTDAVRAAGVKAIPSALDWIRDVPGGQSPYERLRYWLEKASGGRFRLRLRRDRSWDAARVFQILGPDGRPAIPELAEMVSDEHTCAAAVMSLSAIGASSIPVLSNAVASGPDWVRSSAMFGLAELGPAAGPVIPAMIRAGRMSRLDADAALRALERVATNAQDVLPFFVEALGDPCTARRAAYLLGRLGAAGLPSLLLALTNRAGWIRVPAEAALDPRFKEDILERAPSTPEDRYRRFESLCLQKGWVPSWVRWAEPPGPVDPERRARTLSMLLSYSTNANAAIRSAAVDAIHSLETKSKE
jgi:hypothetical protein